MQNTTKNFLNILIGEKLSSVTFVMDYLQAHFDGNFFNFYIWPIVVVNNIEYKFGNPSYRDNLCSLITRIVEYVIHTEDKELIIGFGNNDKFILSLDPNNPDIIVEIATFTDINNNWHVF